jgi:hypothetical protein
VGGGVPVELAGVEEGVVEELAGFGGFGGAVEGDAECGGFGAIEILDFF